MEELDAARVGGRVVYAVLLAEEARAVGPGDDDLARVLVEGLLVGGVLGAFAVGAGMAGAAED